MIEAIFGIYIYRLPWFDYIFVALFMLIAVPIITLTTRRMYKRDHPSEPTDVKQTTFREVYRAANGKIDPVNLILGIAFFIVLIASEVFHQPNILSYATPLIVGPWAIYNGSKMLREEREEQQPYDIHWYTQYKILFGVASIALLPYDLIVRGPFTFVQAYPYANQLEDVFAFVAAILMLVSVFFFFRRQYLKRKRDRVTSDQS